MATVQPSASGCTPKQGEWSTGLCDCCAEPGGCGRCCYGAWCTCFLVGDNFQRMPFNAVLCGGQWGGACLTYVGAQMMIGGGCIPQMMGRTYLRQKYGIAGSEAEDFCCTWCCSACSACQEAREIDIREGVGQSIPVTHAPGQVVVMPMLNIGILPPPPQQLAQLAAQPAAGYPVGPPPPAAYPHGYGPPMVPQAGYGPPPPGYASAPPGYAPPAPQYFAQPPQGYGYPPAAPQGYAPAPPQPQGYSQPPPQGYACPGAGPSDPAAKQ